MISIVDYGVGNLFSLVSSLSALGLEAEVTSSPEKLRCADKIILPGVGAFGDAIKKLSDAALTDVVTDEAKAGKPLLGICLGMQLLFEKSYEFGEHRGLGLIPGEVCDMRPELRTHGFDYKVPQMGWNKLDIKQPRSALMKYSRQGDFVYYVHSYRAKTPPDYIVASSEYGIDVAGAVQNQNVYGTQFHPEKSGEAGLRILKAFSEI
jgi:imidazole glycerol phosphate synthase, glutamine amidotransferase subunit